MGEFHVGAVMNFYPIGIASGESVVWFAWVSDDRDHLMEVDGAAVHASSRDALDLAVATNGCALDWEGESIFDVDSLMSAARSGVGVEPENAVMQGNTVLESCAYNHRGERILRAPEGGNAQITVYDEAGQWLGNYPVLLPSGAQRCMTKWIMSEICSAGPRMQEPLRSDSNPVLVKTGIRARRNAKRKVPRQCRVICWSVFFLR